MAGLEVRGGGPLSACQVGAELGQQRPLVDVPVDAGHQVLLQLGLARERAHLQPGKDRHGKKKEK